MSEVSEDRFDALLEAMATKPPLEAKPAPHEPEQDDDLREEDDA